MFITYCASWNFCKNFNIVEVGTLHFYMSFNFIFSWRWGGSDPSVDACLYASILCFPQMIWVWRATVEWYWQGNTLRTRRKTCPGATLSTTNPTWIDPGANPGLRGERLATNDLSHGMAPFNYINLCNSILVVACNNAETEDHPSFHCYWLAHIHTLFSFCISGSISSNRISNWPPGKRNNLNPQNML
jgi:hypothetical protein